MKKVRLLVSKLMESFWDLDPLTLTYQEYPSQTVKNFGAYKEGINMRRSIIVDTDCDYSNEEIQSIQKELDSKCFKIIVFRDLTNSGHVVLCANADICHSYSTVCDIVGTAYIGNGDEHSV